MKVCSASEDITVTLLYPVIPIYRWKTVSRVQLHHGIRRSHIRHCGRWSLLLPARSHYVVCEGKGESGKISRVSISKCILTLILSVNLTKLFSRSIRCRTWAPGRTVPIRKRERVRAQAPPTRPTWASLPKTRKSANSSTRPRCSSRTGDRTGAKPGTWNRQWGKLPFAAWSTRCFAQNRAEDNRCSLSLPSRLLSWAGKSIEPYGIDYILQKLGFSHARTTIPKWIQRGFMDPLDKLLAVLMLRMVLAVREEPSDEQREYKREK